MNFGTAIKTCREAKGLSRAKLAEDCLLSPSYITLLEQNKRDPNLSVVNKISKALDIPPSILIFLATDKENFESFDKELAEKLSLITLKLIQNAADKSS
ncbi:helix-turn-helix domain-containing protein [Isoalcanivorax pacificus W11-5]|uniref:Helix-turn-helix domain-containing protein n=1 Tax=Isoalcanivorax pacificus W11-5 TaxID=391936 RepID=A0A0B4XTX6_9GAMM|nr:helix-turn-helix transcriptional regulator [Isoalcanivorax pacificus]AJD49742.1 helix-turn-helix domain-containing protein [Isoalcanivorax pacificus W11-5]